jgi:hypothetical protein
MLLPLQEMEEDEKEGEQEEDDMIAAMEAALLLLLQLLWKATGGILVAIVDHNKRVLHNKLSAPEDEEARQEVFASS